jgi:osmotically inducible lipoprotein OsmB
VGWLPFVRELHLQEVRMSQLVRSLAVLSVLGLTAACGDNPTDRALTGGAAGAAGGAVVGSTVGHPVGGAVVGGLGGAAVGAATTPRRDYYY